MEGIANMPRVQNEFEDFVLTEEGILDVVFESGAGKVTALLSGGTGRVKRAFYERFAETSPFGEPNVKLVPWSDVAVVKIYPDLAVKGTRGYPIMEFTTLERTVTFRVFPKSLHGVTAVLRAKIGDRYEGPDL